MDFDSIIPLLFVFFFFILPNLLKALRKKKGKASNQKKETDQNIEIGQKKASLFGKIGEQIGKVLQEIEQQQKQQQQQQQQDSNDSDDIWQSLAAEDEDYDADPTYTDSEYTDEDFIQGEPVYTHQPEAVGQTPDIPIIIEPEPKASIAEEQILKGPEKEAQKRAGLQYRNNPLQNAVLWAEILGKPVALK